MGKRKGRSKGRGGKGRQRRQSKRYDVGMIRDFLEHLLWELRIAHYENTQRRGPDGKVVINEELADQLARCQAKYPRSPYLMLMTVTDADGLESYEETAAVEVLRQQRASEVAEAITHLQALEPVFEEALEAAKVPGREPPPHLFVPLADMLPETRARRAQLSAKRAKITEAVEQLLGFRLKDNAVPISRFTDPSFRKAVVAASLVYAWDIATEMPLLFWGVEFLREIIEDGETPSVSAVVVAVDSRTSELEYLYAAIERLKGSCCYGASDEAEDDADAGGKGEAGE